ncbi:MULTISPECIES: DUF7344 domain-containing protein [Halomicrobium]|uniref:DUF7344 domain-containing protein n=2 Tax=Halomicrobium mukohataei TaxID=57705 RepID=C7NW19_HALMD|nr:MULTISPECIES: hypothetical protein [Halomicrobium]ACV48148.1 hypothetical protein Hmuk_2035 [Halomicrobium mukohataei DSM 12286]QCD66572.1 hypothetical protein E5139_13295 [Halomicrobium mukohataei]QFR21378.1 hypothetical protein GBQ70_13310 [Halomicrobium sp. ZPS1]
MGAEHHDDQLAAVEFDDELSSSSVTVTTVSVDDLFDVLARPANRYVLTYLLRDEGPVYAHELVEYIVDETDPPEGLSEQEYRGQIDSRLLHVSLPKLEDVGLIEFDGRRQRISETDETTAALPYLRFALAQQQSHDD